MPIVFRNSPVFVQIFKEVSMVELTGGDSPYKQSVDNSVLLVAGCIVLVVFGEYLFQRLHCNLWMRDY